MQTTELKEQASLVTNAKEVGENTAKRVGGILKGITEKIEEIETNKIEVVQTLDGAEQNKVASVAAVATAIKKVAESHADLDKKLYYEENHTADIVDGYWTDLSGAFNGTYIYKRVKLDVSNATKVKAKFFLDKRWGRPAGFVDGAGKTIGTEYLSNTSTDFVTLDVPSGAKYLYLSSHLSSGELSVLLIKSRYVSRAEGKSIKSDISVLQDYSKTIPIVVDSADGGIDKALSAEQGRILAMKSENIANSAENFIKLLMTKDEWNSSYPNSVIKEIDVFSANTDPATGFPYRRLSEVMITNEGTTLIACQYQSHSDDFHDFGILLARKPADDESFTYTMITDFNDSHISNTTPAFVVDRTGKHGQAGAIYMFYQRIDGALKCVYRVSTNDGVSWGKEVDLSERVGNNNFCAPANGIQLTDGTLVMPMRIGSDVMEVHSGILIKHPGEEWTLSSPTPNVENQDNECTVFESPAFTVMISSRTSSPCFRSTYEYNMKRNAWRRIESVFVPGVRCQAHIIKAKLYNREELYLMSFPDPKRYNTRQRMTLYGSLDGVNWRKLMRIFDSKGSTEYSSLCYYNDKLYMTYELDRKSIRLVDLSPLVNDFLPYVLDMIGSGTSDYPLQYVLDRYKEGIITFEDKVVERGLLNIDKKKSGYGWFGITKKDVGQESYVNVNFMGMQYFEEYQYFKNHSTQTGANVLNAVFQGNETLRRLHCANNSGVISLNNFVRDCTALQYMSFKGFDWSKMKQCISVFYHCSNLVLLDLTGFNSATIENAGTMFVGCNSLKNIIMDGCDSSSVEWLEAKLVDDGIASNVTIKVGGEKYRYSGTKWEQYN